MSEGYLIVVADVAGAGKVDEIRQRLPDFTLAFEDDRVLVLTAPGQSLIGLPDEGVAIGALFDRDGRQLTSLDRHAVRDRDLQSRLVQDCWGGYVALIAGRADATVSILRDPSGALAAYAARVEGAWWVASSLQVALQAGLPKPQLDWPAVGQMIAFPQVRGVRTGLRNVDELPAGCRLIIAEGGAIRQEMVWSPWSFTAADAQFSTDQEAAGEIRAAVKLSVNAWAIASGRIMLELSGGLDSSIIASALNRDVDVQLINFHTATAEGDERTYASLVAERAHRSLQIVPPEADQVDVGRARLGAHPRPAAQILLQPIEAAFRRVGAAFDVEAFFSGLGGDNVFCALTTAAPTADALLTFGLGRRFLETFNDLCHRHGATNWDVLRLTLRKAFGSRSGGGLKPNLEFLTPAVMTNPPEHPWLVPPRGELPGRREHVAGILVALGFLDRYEHADLAPVRFPLLAQPVLEACLRTPTWMWIGGGRNRAVARDAFRDLLPPEVFHRQTKGGLNAFMGEILDANRAALTAQLERGWLATAGLLDGAAVANALREPKLTASQMTRILQLADAEAWARTWAITGQSHPAP